MIGTWRFWAVEARLWRDRSNTVLLGAFWFVQKGYEGTPGLDGPRTALFGTRQAARDAIQAKGFARYRARPVRVVCTVRKVRQ